MPHVIFYNIIELEGPQGLYITATSTMWRMWFVQRICIQLESIFYTAVVIQELSQSAADWSFKKIRRLKVFAEF